MFDITTMRFPVLALTPNGVMPYSKPDNLLKCMTHEYDMGWYDDLEIVDSEGVCAVVRSASVVKRPILARVFGRMVEVRIADADKLGDYDVTATRDRVLEFLTIYPNMYQSAGIYDELVRKVSTARSSQEIVRAFME